MGGPIINIFDRSESHKASEHLKITALSEIAAPMAALGVMAQGIQEHLDGQEYLDVPYSIRNEMEALVDLVSETMPTMLADIARANELNIDEFSAAVSLSVFVEGWQAYFRGQPAPGSSTVTDEDDLSSLLEDLLSQDCGNPACPVHGPGGLASMLRQALTGDDDPFSVMGDEDDGWGGFDNDPFGFGSTDDVDEYPFNFGRNGYTDRQRDFITGQAETPGCGDPNCPVCNGTFAGANLDFEEINLNDVEPDSDLGQMAQAFADAGIRVADGRIYGMRIS